MFISPDYDYLKKPRLPSEDFDAPPGRWVDTSDATPVRSSSVYLGFLGMADTCGGLPDDADELYC